MNITYRVFKGTDVDFLKELVNELMKFQADHATIHPEIMGSMNYSNRLKPEFKGSSNEHMLIAYDGETPIGFAYGNISEVTKENFMAVPSMIANLSGKKFYPENYQLPKSIGTFKLLYVKETYRGFSIGQQLTATLMDWLKSQDVQDLWVYVANGNENVGKFYEKYGFHFSHSVCNGFIDAYVQEL